MDLKKFENSPIFICGHRKSGTTLFLNLLDSHSQLSAFPSDSGFFYKYYPLCDINQFSKEEKIKVLINEIIENPEGIRKDIEDLKKRGFEVGFDIEKFKKDFLERIEKSDYSTKSILIEFNKSFFQNFQHSLNIEHWVEKTTSTEFYAADIFSWFPNAKFIHIIRDPRDNWASLKSGWKKKYQNLNDSKERLLQSLLDRGMLGFKFAKHNLEEFGKEKYLIIKYEELTKNPKDTLESVAKFLGIKFDSILLKPTIFGKPWKGNNFDGIEFDSISDVNVGRWEERIEKKEAQIIEFHFDTLMEDFGYKSKFSNLEKMNAAKEHYKWFNFAQIYSYKKN